MKKVSKPVKKVIEKKVTKEVKKVEAPKVEVPVVKEVVTITVTTPQVVLSQAERFMAQVNRILEAERENHNVITKAELQAIVNSILK